MNTNTIAREISIEEAGVFIGIFTADQYEAAHGERVDSAYVVRTHRDGYLETDDATEALAFAAEVAEDTADNDPEHAAELLAFAASARA